MYIRAKRKQKQGIFLSPRNPHPQILIKSRLEMKNENDRPLFLRTSHHLYVLFHITRVKTIQPLILHISSAETYPLLRYFLPAIVPVSGEMSTDRGGGEGRNKIVCPLLADSKKSLMCRSCGRVSLPGRCFSLGFTRRRYVKREYLEYRAGKGFGYESSRETDRSWQGWATIKPAPEAYWAGCF